MRILSLIIAGVYIALPLVAAPHKELKSALGMSLAFCAGLVFPLLCIWFGDEMGEYVGKLPGPAINKTSPGGLVRAGGWVLLLMPLAVWWFAFRA